MFGSFGSDYKACDGEDIEGESKGGSHEGMKRTRQGIAHLQTMFLKFHWRRHFWEIFFGDSNIGDPKSADAIPGDENFWYFFLRMLPVFSFFKNIKLRLDMISADKGYQTISRQKT